MPAPSELGAIVLCGGASSRMGAPKAWIDFDGEPMLARVVRVVAEAASPIVVVAAPGQELPALPSDVEIARDPERGLGPLQGIAAGMAALEGRASAAFVASTDLPLLRSALIRALHRRWDGSAPIVAPSAGGKVHPLAAIYALSLRAEIEARVAARRLRVMDLLEATGARLIDEATLRAAADLVDADPGLDALRNVNTAEDLAAALAIARRR